MPRMCSLRVSSQCAARLGKLVSVLARDGAFLDGQDRSIPTSNNNTTSSQRHKYELRDHAEAALQSLAEGTVNLEPDTERARLRARHFAGRK